MESKCASVSVVLLLIVGQALAGIFIPTHGNAHNLAYKKRFDVSMSAEEIDGLCVAALNALDEMSKQVAQDTSLSPGDKQRLLLKVVEEAANDDLVRSCFRTGRYV